MSIKVKGLDSAIRALRKKGQDAERAILDELEDTATNIEKTAMDETLNAKILYFLIIAFGACTGQRFNF
jgi:hypothetical protein